MQRSDRWPAPDPEPPRPRRGSVSSRRSSVSKERDVTAASAQSTPKKTRAREGPEFMVTGKPLLKKSDRANSLPGCGPRRGSEAPRASPRAPPHSAPGPALPDRRLREHIEIEDTSLDLSQVSDFSDSASKFGRPPLATSTPRRGGRRSASVQHSVSKVDRRPEAPGRDATFCSDALYRTSSLASPYRGAEEYSSVSPECSPSSADTSPPRRAHIHSCSISTCAECSSSDRGSAGGARGAGGAAGAGGGEWSRFWLNYSLPAAPLARYYDHCPTPYRTDTFDTQDLDFSTDDLQKRSMEDISDLNNIIKNEGLHLTPRETQNIIKCAHILSNVLTQAMERHSKDNDDTITKIQEAPPEIPEEKPDKIDPEFELKKKTMSLNLKETVMPLEVKEEKTSETVQTQTDISLPNTKSAPRIFESILRQLSRTSLEEKKATKEEDKDNKKEITEENIQNDSEVSKNEDASQREECKQNVDNLEVAKSDEEIIKKET